MGTKFESRLPLGLARAVKGRAKAGLKWARDRYIALFHRFDNADLTALLRRLGLRANDVVLAHIAFNEFLGFQGGPGDVIHVLQSVVGEGGTVLMPTMPFSGTALEYAQRCTLTDLARAPSGMGLVTEIFRRMPGVVRSVHPTHPVAAWGARAAELTRDHHLAETPCGKNSPFLRLLEVEGKVLLLGAGIQTMTLYHGIEEILEPQMPFSPFTEARFELRARDPRGVVWVTKTRLFDPEVSARRDVSILVPELRRRGAWHEGKVGRLRAAVVRGSEVLSVCEELAREGRFCYRRKRWRR
jgi:aminoglycoside 3-N-acetyltransferase